MKVQNAVDLKRTEHPRWWLILLFALISIGLGVTLILNPFEDEILLMIFIGGSTFIVADALPIFINKS